MTDPANIDDRERIQAARNEVIGAMANAAEACGAKRSYGRLYGILFFAEEPLSLDALAAESGYAKSTVSTAMTTLERFHMVQRRSLPGEGKRAFYEAEDDFWYAVQQFLEVMAKRELETMSRSFAASAMLLEELDVPEADADLERVRRLEAVADQCDAMLGILTESSFDELAEVADAADDGD